GLDSFVLAQLNKAYADAKATGDAKADTEWQPRLAKSLPKQPSPTRWIDWSNMIALAAVGAGLMLGLFTRLSALGGIGLLMMYYWAMPSLPWLPEAGPTEGHYLFINKNVIEALALAMIATSRVGRWGGLDGLLFRRRRIEAASR
ncbi:MAG: DoxX family membrane protein, partial [Planctomycetes bacterium]|nr:DoxX family membrane protein [Planctomycetota bacterium]